MAGPGLEPENGVFPNYDNFSKTQDINITHHTNNEYVKNSPKIFSLEDYGQISNSEKHIIDTFRAQYKHNEIPEELIKLIETWPKIPESLAKGIVTMVECYIYPKE